MFILFYIGVRVGYRRIGSVSKSCYKMAGLLNVIEIVARFQNNMDSPDLECFTTPIDNFQFIIHKLKLST